MIGETRWREGRVLCLLFALLLFVALLAIGSGSASISPQQTLAVIWERVSGQALSGVDVSAAQKVIILQLRIPRVILAILVGSSLSLAGAAMQALIRNPLADGSTLGVTSGGSLGAVLCIALGLRIGPWPQLSVALLSIVFAFLSLLLILAFARRLDPHLSSNTIILAGVIFSMLASSLSSLIISFSGEAVREIVFWTMGSLSGRGWEAILLLLPFVLIGQLLIFRHVRELDALALGEEQAAYLGVRVVRVRFSLLFSCALLCGATVAVCGNIAFVGLAIPHLVRLVSGPLNLRLLPRVALSGAVFLLLCDWAARTLIQPLELPIGVITSIIGAVVFIVLFYRQRPRT